MSILASGITKIILGGAAMSLGAAGALRGLWIGESKEESLKTVSAKNIEKPILEAQAEESNSELSTEPSPSGSELSKTETPNVGESVQESVPVQKSECRLHKLVKETSGLFQPTTKEELEKDISRDRASDFQKIKEVCDSEENKGKDIFVSNKNKGGWRYYPEEQERLKDAFNKYLTSKSKE